MNARQSSNGASCELVVEVDRLTVVELGPQPARHRQRVLHGLPVDGVVHVAVQVDVGHPQRPRYARCVVRRVGQPELGRDVAARRSVGVHAEVLDADRPLFGVEVDPDAVDLDAAAGVALHRPPPAGRDRRHAAAPGRQLDLGVADERLDHVDADAAHEPQVLRQPPARSPGRRRWRCPGESGLRRRAAAARARPGRRGGSAVSVSPHDRSSGRECVCPTWITR